MAEKTHAPKIRFKGFTDTWEQHKVGDYYEFKNGLNKGKEFFGEGTPIVNFTDVFHNRGISPEMLSGRVRLEPSEIKNYEVKKGDIFFTRTSETIEEIGYPSVMLEAPENTVFSGFVLRGRCNLKDDPLDNLFKKYLFFTDAFRDEMLRKSSMTTRALTSGTAIKNMEFLHPSLKEEQHRIGEFITSLDHLITLHQCKYSELQILKKAMLEKMFPKNGSSFPEIRFKGFTDAWEQRKFSDITFPAGEKNKENLPLESYSITNESGFVPQDEKFENGGTMREADKRMYYIVSPNSFAYNPARINVGSIGYQDTGKSVIVSSLYEVFKTSDDVDDRLLWHWFKSPDFQKLIMQLQEGGVRLYFYYDKLCMGQVFLPSLEEQRKIGKLFDTLDHLITLHQRKLDTLEHFKKALLEKMFV